METIFENQYKRTKEYYKERIKDLRNKMKVIVLYILIILVLFTGFLSYVLSFNYYDTSFIGAASQFYIFVSYGLLIFTIYNNKKNKKLAYIQDIKINNGKPVDVRFSLTEEEIEFFCISTGTKIIVNLTFLKKIIKGRNYYYLITQSRSFDFKRDSFTKGTAEEFEAFLRDKGFNF